MTERDFNFSASPGLDFPNPSADQGMTPQAPMDLRSRHRAVEAAAQAGGGRMPPPAQPGFAPQMNSPMGGPQGFIPGQIPGNAPNPVGVSQTEVPIQYGPSETGVYTGAATATPSPPNPRPPTPVPPDDLSEILGVGTGDQDEPATSVDAARSKLTELQESLGEKKSKKAIGVTLIVFTLLVLAFLAIGSLRDSNMQKEIEAVRAPYLEFSPKSVEVSKVVYTDSVKISKLARVEDGAMQCYFKGKPKDFGQTIMIPVSSAVYRAVDDGATVKITYQIITLRTDGETTDYAINAKVMTK